MLPPRARIAVVSPSGVSDPARLDAGLALLRDWGFTAELLPHARATHRYLAGTDTERLADLRLAFGGGYDAVWMARGGYGLGRLLSSLDPATLAPVPFFGFSDGTVLLNHLAAAGHPAVHAPVVHALASHNDEASRTHLRALLAGAATVDLPGRVVVEGAAEGRLVGGNLCMLASSCGTPHQVDCHGAIVLLEEIGEAPYKVDRLLTQCREAGLFRGARAFVLGEFLHTPPPADAGWTLDDVLHDGLSGFGVPILAGVGIGHGATNLAVPLGRRAEVEGGRLRVCV
jgi:muramoyltetrapeptide carboxypeptidase